MRNFLLATLWYIAGQIVGFVEIGSLLWILDLGAAAALYLVNGSPTIASRSRAFSTSTSARGRG